MTWVVVAAVVVVIAVVLALIARSRRAPDGVTTFQRQIDALSPDARRSVVRSVEDLRRKKPRSQVEVEAASATETANEFPAQRPAPARRGMVGDPLGGTGTNGGPEVNDGA